MNGHVRRMGAFLRYAGLLEGGIAVCLIFGTYALLGLPPSLPLLAAGFCGTCVVYQADRMLGLAPEDALNRPERLRWAAQHRRFLVATVVLAAVGGGLALLALRPAAQGLCLVLALLSVLYVAPLLPGGRRLKSLGLLKPFAISGGWAVGGVVLPVVQAGLVPGLSTLALAGYRFLIVLANALLSDRPDREGDAQAGLRTPATRWRDGSLRALAAGALLLAISGAAVAVQAAHATHLLYVDLVGPLLLLPGACVPGAWTRGAYRLYIDLVVAWPAVTALVALGDC